MSLPDDENREPDDHLAPEEMDPAPSEEQPAFATDEEAEVVGDNLAEPGPEVEAGAEDTPGADEAEVAAAPAEDIDETLEFAAPAETESGIAFDAIASEGDATEEPGEAAGEELLAGLAGLADESTEFSLEKAEDEVAEDEEEAEEADKKKPGKRPQRILAAIGQSDPYTVLMGIALLALLFGLLFFYLELSAYNFDIGAERAKQLVGSLGFDWLLWLT